MVVEAFYVSSFVSPVIHDLRNHVPHQVLIHHHHSSPGWLEFYKIPRATRRKVRQYFKGFFKEHPALNETAILDDMNPGLREEVCRFLIPDIVRATTLFRELPTNILARIVMIMTPVTYTPGDTVQQQGKVGRMMHIIVGGRALAIYDKHSKHDNSPVEPETQELQAGSTVGELVALNVTSVYDCTVEAQGLCAMFLLTKERILERFSSMPEVMAQLRQNAQVFESQELEQRRVNVSLNLWDTTENALGIRTMMECGLSEIFPASEAQDAFAATVKKTLGDSMLVHGRRHSFVAVGTPNEYDRYLDQLMNKLSSLSPEGHLRFDMGLAVTQTNYVFAMTFEKTNTARQNRKFRLLLIREDLLRHVPKKPPESVHKRITYFHERWQTLKQLHDLYFEEDSLSKPARRRAHLLMISNPRRPLKICLSGSRVHPYDPSVPPWPVFEWHGDGHTSMHEFDINDHDATTATSKSTGENIGTQQQDGDVDPYAKSSISKSLRINFDSREHSYRREREATAALQRDESGPMVLHDAGETRIVTFHDNGS